MSKIGVLGGTFDPVHAGHLALAHAAKEEYALDRVIFVPAFIPPHKQDRQNITPAPFRYRMVETAIKDHPGFEISDVEFVRPGPSYTVDTLRTLKNQNPEDQLFLIIGADSLPEIPRWKKPDEICKLAEFLVAPRSNVEVKNPFSSGVHWIHMKEIPISASNLRQMLERGEMIPPDILPTEVLLYIHQHHLYESKGSCR